MSTTAKNKWLMGFLVLLLLANAVTLTMLWMGKRNPPPRPGGDAAEYIIRETGFDSTQEKQYRVLIKDHQDSARVIRNEIKEAKDQFFNLLSQGKVSDSLKQQYANRAAALTANLDILTLNHFEKVKAICRPDQLPKFEKIISEAVRMMGPRPQGGSGRPDGPPNHPDGPPPPPPGE